MLMKMFAQNARGKVKSQKFDVGGNAVTSIYDVAKETGVSISTVSRVINGYSNVLPKTRELVEEAIQRLNYHPNRLAQQFRSQRSNMILVIVPDIGNSFFSEILTGIEDVASKMGYSVLLMDSRGAHETENRCYEMLTQKLVDGIITFSVGIPKEELKRLATQNPIVVGLRYFADQHIANVTIDNIKAIKDITSYMLNLGHKKICYLAGPEDVPVYQDRIRGYKEALQERGIPVSQSLITHCQPNVQGGYDAISSLLHNADQEFSAIVASGDIMAIGAMRALNDRGIKVPDDVAISGFDDIAFAALVTPSLTTVRQPKYQIGVRTMEKLMDLIAGKELSSHRDVLNYEIVIRESSGSYVGN